MNAGRMSPPPRAGAARLDGDPLAQPAQPVVHRAVEANVRTIPDRPAVVCDGTVWSYAELDRRAEALADRLRAAGIGRGSLVGLFLDRSPHLVCAIVAVLKTGAAYVPLDTTYPRPRIATMITDLDTLALVLVSEDTVADLPRTDVPHWTLTDTDPASVGSRSGVPEPPLASDTRGEDLCYVVFTSGSTGKPKAVGIRHAGWYNLLEWLRVEYALDRRSSGLMVSSFGFDISQRALMAPLFVGAAIHLVPGRYFDLAAAFRCIASERIQTVHCAPTSLYLLMDREVTEQQVAIRQMAYVFIGGEPFSLRRIRRWQELPGNRCVLLHQYGVAECTDVASSYAIPAEPEPEPETDVPPVGRPVYNTNLHILDPDLEPVPPGKIGEVCISGRSVGAGYVNGDGAARFITLSLPEGPVRAYLTGDRGFIVDDELVIVGRSDTQVKIRGMRVDTLDVERVVKDLPSVADAVVLAIPSADDRELVACVVPVQGPPLEPRAVQRDLRRVLPQTMVPSRVVELKSLPLNTNGKVDRKGLADSLTGEMVTG